LKKRFDNINIKFEAKNSNIHNYNHN
jgi:hypothetical protein